MVNEDGLLKLKGNPGVMVFIDDKPTQLSGADLANYLKTLTNVLNPKQNIHNNVAKV